MAKSGPNTSISLKTLAGIKAAAQPAAADVPPVQSLLAAVNDARESTLDLLDAAAEILNRGPRGETQELRRDAAAAQEKIRFAQHRIRELVAAGVAAMPPGMMPDGWAADLLATLDRLTTWNADEVWHFGKVRTGTGDELTPANLPAYLDVQARSLTAMMTAMMNVVGVAAGSAMKEAPTRRRKNRVKPATERPLSALQSETVQVVGECKGNYAEAARRMGKDRKTVEECYKTAMKKLGRAIVKHKTKAMGTDRRGQADLGTDDDRRLN